MPENTNHLLSTALNRLEGSIHDLDTRVAVLESQTQATQVEMMQVHADALAVKEAVLQQHTHVTELFKAIEQRFIDHVTDEAKELARTHRAVIATLFATLLSILAWLGTQVWTDIHP